MKTAGLIRQSGCFCLNDNLILLNGFHFVLSVNFGALIFTYQIWIQKR